MKTCFIVSPIGGEGTDIRKRADKLFKHIIWPVCNECGFKAVRVDQINQADSITQTIIDYLRKSELVIADMTGHNPNAFYEMGFRASTGRPIVHMKEKEENIPFDIAGIRAFDYDLTDLDAVDEVKERLKQTILAFGIDDNLESSGSTDEPETVESQNEASQLLPVLYQILDSIAQLKTEIHNKDTDTIQAIVKAIQPSVPVEDPNTAIMKALIPEMLKNPNSMRALMEIGEIAQKKK